VFAHRTRDSLRRHRWAVDFIGSRPPSTPNDVRNLERLLALLDGLGVEDVRLIFGIFMTVATCVIGAVIREAQAEHERYHAWSESAGEFPDIAKLMKSGVDPDDPDTREERFQFSLDCVLDGIAARLTQPPASTSGHRVRDAKDRG